MLTLTIDKKDLIIFLGSKITKIFLVLNPKSIPFSFSFDPIKANGVRTLEKVYNLCESSSVATQFIGANDETTAHVFPLLFVKSDGQNENFCKFAVQTQRTPKRNLRALFVALF